MNHHYVGIMAGGIGSRFWPASRSHFPKQFLDILGTGKSLLQMTYDRFASFIPKENIFIISSKQYENLILEQLDGLSKKNILSEPMRRNTAPCVAYFAHKIHAADPKASMVIAPSDHLILEEKVFENEITKALNYVDQNDDLITLGIKPTRPATGYGYIQYLKNQEASNGVFNVKTFTEKPPLELAKTFIESGDFLWNAGIFVWNVKSIVNAFSEHLNEVHELFAKGESIYNTEGETEFIEKTYSLCPNISIDYAIMEKAANVRVIPASFGWSDLGTWKSLYKNSNRDYMDNAVNGNKVMTYDTSNCLINVPKDKLVIVMNMDGYCVVDREDVLLICKTDDEQRIKEVTADVRQKYGDDFI